MAAVGKAYGGAGSDASAAQHLGATFQIKRHDADAGDLVAVRQFNAKIQFRDRQRRIQERVVDHAGDIFVGVFDLGHNLFLICRGTVESGHGNVVQPHVHGELSAMMYGMIHHHIPNDLGAGQGKHLVPGG